VNSVYGSGAIGAADGGAHHVGRGHARKGQRGYMYSPELPGSRSSATWPETSSSPRQIQDEIATHGASDMVCSVAGRGSTLFPGVMDNTDLFFR